jgi:hypothetical protein
MDFKLHFEKAWKLTFRFIVPLLLLTLVMVGVSFLSLGILAPVTMAGYFQSLLLLVREGREPRVQDVFSQMRLFWPLLGFSILFFIAAGIGFLLLVLPGILITLGVSFACLYMLFFMTDRRLNLVEAVRQSYDLTVRGRIADQIVVFVIFMGLSSIGSSLFILWLLTQPLATVFLASVYEELQGEREPVNR